MSFYHGVRYFFVGATVGMVSCAFALKSDAADFQAELIFPLESWHNHGSCIVEYPNGDLLVCWFHGSGERKADDVVIMGARKRKGSDVWSAPFLMADTPEFPDTNCSMIIDQQNRLWLFWPVIMANLWESALMKYQTSTNYMVGGGAPKWDERRVLHFKPGDDFESVVRTKTEAYFEGKPVSDRARGWAEGNYKQAADKLTRRLGWFTRAHPKILDDGRMLLGLYSDGFSFSMTAISDDIGASWWLSEPMVGGGNIQPSYAVKKDGTIVAYMRDNGPPPKRVLVSESSDRGETWGVVYDHATLPNPGAGLEVMNLRDGDWLAVYNDTERGRHSLAVSVSEDDGATWAWTRHIELEEPNGGSFHYPSVIEASDGMIHVSYSVFVSNPDGSGEGKSIKHAAFTKEWVLAGDKE